MARCGTAHAASRPRLGHRHDGVGAARCAAHCSGGRFATILSGRVSGAPSPWENGRQEGSMRVTVLGAGSWGTTVAALLCRRDHEVLLWARKPEVADEVGEQRTNAAYLPGARLPARLRAT